MRNNNLPSHHRQLRCTLPALPNFQLSVYPHNMNAFLAPAGLRTRPASLAPAPPCPRRPSSTPRAALAPPPARRQAYRGAPAEEPWCRALEGRADMERVLSTGALTAHEGTDSVVVVIFVAGWCRVCKTLLGKIRRFARAHPHVTFHTVDFATAENKPLCDELGVRMLPTFRLYRNPDSIEDVVDMWTSGPFGTKLLVDRLVDIGVEARMPRP